MTDWVRLWHDMPTDPKWRTIARKSEQRVGDVIAVFNFLMVNASGNATERGKVAGFDCEDVATALDLDESDVRAILDSMRGKVMDAEDRLTGWEKRQPKREDSTAATRKAAWKERQRNAGERSGTQGNAPETETETETEETPLTPQGAKRAYAFVGKVCRLNKRDYDQFHGQFFAIADFNAELAAFDGWISDQPEAKQAKWFGSLAPWLNKRHQEALSAKGAARPVKVGV
jgi:hypothetical protein